MNSLYIYADSASRQVLSDTHEKALLIGGDTGYGNFGDIIQHVNTKCLVNNSNRYKTVSVFTIAAISSPDFPRWARYAFQTDAVIFFSHVPHIFTVNQAGIELVSHVRNLSVLFLYGGGFLNEMWGNNALSVAEFFLEHCPRVTYLVSGQQVTNPFERRVVDHINRYQPQLFGVRDQKSLEWMESAGYTPSFSFDDATELLLNIGNQTLVKSDRGVLLHLNVSDYTGNDRNLEGLIGDLNLLKMTVFEGEEVNVAQAFMDRRQNIKDTNDAVKLLEIDFPFNDYRFIELSSLCYPGLARGLSAPLLLSRGYSCSYHIALWLQLNGIPCYLRSKNPYYDQKSNALQSKGSFDDFLRNPVLADHRNNLERRKSWLAQVRSFLEQAPALENEIIFDHSEDQARSRQFYFKGNPTLEEELNWWTAHGQQLEMELFKVQIDNRQLAEQVVQIVQSPSWRLIRPLGAVARFAPHGNFDSQGQPGFYRALQQVGRLVPMPAPWRKKIGALLSKFRRQT
jgi:hypothetical protein